MSKVCKFALTGDLLSYENDADLSETIHQMFPDNKHSKLYMIDTDDTFIHKYAFFTPLIVRIYLTQLETSSHNMDWSKVVNESLLDLCISYIPPFPNLFTNPHPKIFELIQALDPISQITKDLICDASSNPNVDVRRWCFQNYPQWVHFPHLLLYDDIPGVDDAAIEWWSQLPNEFEKQKALRHMCNAMSTRIIDFVVEKSGGLTHIMRQFSFVKSRAPRVIELKKQYLNSDTVDDDHRHHILRGLLIHETNNEIISLVIECMLRLNIYPDVETLMLSQTYLWSRSCPSVVEHILAFLQRHDQEGIVSPLSEGQQSELSINKDPRIVSYLLDPKFGPNWRRLPMFLCQTSDKATKWSLEWLSCHINDDVDTTYEWLSINSNVEMVMTLYEKYPISTQNDAECEWLLSVGKNPDILVEFSGINS